jgi:hypothetical protein
MDKCGLFLKKKCGLFLMELAPGSRGRKSGFENLAFCMQNANLPFSLKGSPEPPLPLPDFNAKPRKRQERQD